MPFKAISVSESGIEGLVVVDMLKVGVDEGLYATDDAWSEL